MAKIRCKNCKKRFDPEVYSGLCPKCGTYHGSGLAIGGSKSGGAETVGEKRTFDSREKQRGQTTAFSAFLVLILAIVGTVLVAAGIFVIVVANWEKAYIRAGLASESRVLKPDANGELLWEEEGLKYPIITQVLEAGTAGPADGLSGKILYGVRLKARSDGYNYGSRLDGVYLSYETKEGRFYREPLDSWELDTALPRLGLTQDALLSIYGIGNGKEDGYWFFLAEQEGTDFTLLLQVRGERKTSYQGRLEVEIPLAGVPELTMVETEQED